MERRFTYLWNWLVGLTHLESIRLLLLSLLLTFGVYALAQGAPPYRAAMVGSLGIIEGEQIGVSKYFVYSGGTLTSSQLGSGLVYWLGSAMDGITFPQVSGNTAFVVIKDMSGSGITIWSATQLTGVTTHHKFFKDGSWGNKIWVPAGNLGHQLTITDVITGTSNFHDISGSIGSNWVLEQ